MDVANFESSRSRAWESTTIRAGVRFFSPRAVSNGSSASAVPNPTMIPSTRPRMDCTISRECGLVIHWLSPCMVAIFPSMVIAHFAIIHGRPLVTRLWNGAIKLPAASASTPTSTWIPASVSFAIPRPETSGLGSTQPITTRATLASISASAQGPVFPT